MNYEGDAIDAQRRGKELAIITLFNSRAALKNSK